MGTKEFKAACTENPLEKVCLMGNKERINYWLGSGVKTMLFFKMGDKTTCCAIK